MMKIMTTFRLLRQTNRSSRFALVTVQVEPSNRLAVEVAATVAVEHRSEADLGARWALRGLATPVRVRVTDVIVSEVDTGPGDVYEATARAVWQALTVEQSEPYVGFSDSELVTAWLNTMVGQRLDAVTESRSDAAGLIHVWLHFASAVPLQLRGCGEQLRLAKQDPGDGPGP